MFIRKGTVSKIILDKMDCQTTHLLVTVSNQNTISTSAEMQEAMYGVN